jgi:hypothetical protein
VRNSCSENGLKSPCTGVAIGVAGKLDLKGIKENERKKERHERRKG